MTVCDATGKIKANGTPAAWSTKVKPDCIHYRIQAIKVFEVVESASKVAAKPFEGRYASF